MAETDPYNQHYSYDWLKTIENLAATPNSDFFFQAERRSFYIGIKNAVMYGRRWMWETVRGPQMVTRSNFLQGFPNRKMDGPSYNMDVCVYLSAPNNLLWRDEYCSNPNNLYGDVIHALCEKPWANK